MFLGGVEEKKLYFAPEIWRDKLPLAKSLEVWKFLIASSPYHLVKSSVYGLIRPNFVVWALGSYNLPFADFQRTRRFHESILALPWYKLYEIFIIYAFPNLHLRAYLNFPFGP
jgi:hypothetical protein